MMNVYSTSVPLQGSSFSATQHAIDEKCIDRMGTAATWRLVLPCSHLGKVCRGSRSETIHILRWGSSVSFRRAYVILGAGKLPATSLRRLSSARVSEPVTTTFP